MVKQEGHRTKGSLYTREPFRNGTSVAARVFCMRKAHLSFDILWNVCYNDSTLCWSKVSKFVREIEGFTVNQREHLSSRLGFILLSAGCAIGCGNVWKFPWLAGQNGGGGFVLIYIICLIVLGLPVMTMEFALGRASQASPVKMYQALAASTLYTLKGVLP